MAKTYKIYESQIVERSIDYCEQCDFSSFTYTGNGGFCGAICQLHQRHLESEREHINIPEWCKVDACKYPYSERR